MENQNKNSHAYLQTQVLTASPEQLQLMLYDGAIRFCEQALVAIQTKEIENSYVLITKAENIILEFINSLRDDVAPDTCENMRRLYLFCYEKLVEANLKKQLPPLENALKVLRHMRETWLLLIDKLNEERTQTSSSDSGEPNFDPNDILSEADNLLSQEIGSTVNFQG